MTRAVAVVLALLAGLALVASPALAQAPTPKVTISAVIDNVGTIDHNMNMTSFERNIHGGMTQGKDNEFYGRTRGRWDVIGEIGKAKAVMGLEVDMYYGQVGATDVCNGKFATTSPGTTLAGTCGSDGRGMDGGFDADNDVHVPFELKWMYVEFPLTGAGSLLPFIPFEGSMRVGGMDYGLGLKPSVLADTDFGGVQANLKLAPNVKLSITYVQWEENLMGPGVHGNAGVLGGSKTFSGGTVSNVFGRGDDWGTIWKADVEPFKGLRVSPIVTYQELDGTTSGIVRIPAGGYGFGAGNVAPDVTSSAAGVATVTNCVNNGGAPAGKCRSTMERRYTAGIDFRIDSGPLYVWPTVFYQWGTRDRLESSGDPGSNSATLGVRHASISAFLADVQAGFRLGPLLIEGRGLYTPGNEAKDNLNKSIKYYQPFQTGNSYWSGWGEAHGPGSIDYLTSLNSFSTPYALAATPSYDRYGRIMFTGRATYSLTPALSFWGAVTPEWTAEKVNTNQTMTSNGLALPVSISAATQAVTTRPCDRACGDGQSRYLGTDVSAGFTYRFAPGLTFDLAGGYLWSGAARDGVYDANQRGGLSSPDCAGTTCQFQKFDADNVYTVATRVRFAF